MFYTREKPILNGVGMNIFINLLFAMKKTCYFLFFFLGLSNSVQTS